MTINRHTQLINNDTRLSLFFFRFHLNNGRTRLFCFHCESLTAAWSSLIDRVDAQGYDLTTIAAVELDSMESPRESN
jgi:hypothetical protein